MKLESNCIKGIKKPTNIEAKQHITKKRLGQRRNKRWGQKYVETNEIDNTTYQNFWDAVKAVIRGNYIFTGLSQETREIPSKQPNITS